MKTLSLALFSLTACAVDTSSTDPAATQQVGTPQPAAVDRDRNPAPMEPPGGTYNPEFDAADMDTHIDVPFNPLPVGAKWHYRKVSDAGTELIDIVVLAGTFGIGGTRARIIHDVARLDGRKIEDTTDWFAQDDDDNVWYLGEATTFFNEDGTVTHEGSWKTGVQGAKPGVQMLSRPQIGDKYRQEFLRGHAEDFAIVIGKNKTVTVPAGTFHGCLQTEDKSSLDLALDEIKYYCPGVGLVLIEEGTDREELVSYSGL